MSITWLGLAFWTVSIVNGVLAIYHAKHARVPSRLLLAVAFAFLGMACWFNAFATASPPEEVYAVSLMIYFSRVFLILNIIFFSGAMMHLFAQELTYTDMAFLVVPVVAIIISLIYSPYDYSYYSYGWDISNYNISALLMGPFAAANLFYVVRITLPNIKKIAEDGTRKKMLLFLSGWCLSFITWGLVVGLRLLTGLPDVSTIVMSAIMFITQYPFFTQKVKALKQRS